MKITAKKIEATKLELSVEVTQETVKKELDAIYDEIAKDAKIPGFRPGKAPRDVIQKHHKGPAEQEVVRRLIPKAYKEYVEKENIDALELSHVSDVKLSEYTLSFKAIVEMVPKIEIKNYKHIGLKYKKVEVSPDEIEKVLGELKEAHKVDSIDERFCRGLGYSTAEELKKNIECQLFTQKSNDYRYRLQEDLIKAIVDKVDFTLPESLVKRRQEELLLQLRDQMFSRGLTQQKWQEKEKELGEGFLKDAKMQIKTFLVLQEIAKRENIPLDNSMSAKAIEFLMREADWE